VQIEGSHSEAVGNVGIFATTNWSLVLRAGKGDGQRAAEALEQLCRIYWYPLYAHARRRGNTPADAEDLTQGFFLSFLSRGDLAGLAPEKARFRIPDSRPAAQGAGSR
jgi:RNA polymerase sigma-70 factor (ECF subfamily)